MKRSDLLLIALVVAVGQVVNAEEGASPAKLRQMAADYYRWRNQTYPVASSDQGLHTWDDKLTDYSAEAVAAQHQHVNQLLAQVKGMATDSWSRDDRIDWLLFRAQLEREAFWARVLHADLCP